MYGYGTGYVTITLPLSVTGTGYVTESGTMVEIMVMVM